MLKLKSYQERVLNELKEFLLGSRLVGGEKGIRFSYMDMLGDEAVAYKPIDKLEATPFVCIKVPTGGGKTLIGTHSLGVMQNNYLQEKIGNGLVLWLVPSDAIRTQTLNSLKDRNHPYREALDQQFNSNVKVFTVEEALSVTKADLSENLCIVVSSLSAFRREDSSWLKVFQNNGALLSHFEELVEQTDFLDKEDGEIIKSLANVIAINSPIVIVDEGHNAQTPLSFDMLRKLNPSIIIELTATPRKESNVLVQVLASELKAEKMVKIPIYLSNVTQWQEAIRDGVSQRNNLEKLAQKEKQSTKEYIRPIALLQAEQEKESDSKVYVQQLKDFLINELKVLEDEIAVKTAKQDDIKNIDLLAANCKIRYIITVNALKEGWDCPFAYVLISVANIGSRIAVEQTIGRILRLPSVKDKKNQELNCSFVFASTENFSRASSVVIKGLENNGFSKEDLRQYTGKVTAEKEEFGRQVNDNNIDIPYISLKGSQEPLAFSRDLLGEDFNVNDYFEPFVFDYHSDQNVKVKIDVDKESGFYRVVQGHLALILNPEDFSEEELTNWLKKNVQHKVISSQEMGIFLDKSLKMLLQKQTLDELSINRFRLKEIIKAEIAKIIEKYALVRFENFNKNGYIISDKVTFDPPKTTLLTRVTDEYFQKHLFEKAGYLNGEETDFAFRVDGLENVAWWFRNREKLDFYLQGWKPNKFYPDYIIKTVSGKYLLVEYKGEDRLSNEDTQYKVKLGELWQELNKDKNQFFLAGKANSDEIIKTISVL
ncbi:MAG TPA: DEAD/DEAH box helicase family protein [Candidatus Saccharimonadales bacterium]|jgi:superfamily II DNA or RNA helicase|nr:DEAD/DEAH box helicase family protein [Candidatus Saccharimonadales bacterium]